MRRRPEGLRHRVRLSAGPGYVPHKVGYEFYELFFAFTADAYFFGRGILETIILFSFNVIQIFRYDKARKKEGSQRKG